MNVKLQRITSNVNQYHLTSVADKTHFASLKTDTKIDFVSFDVQFAVAVVVVVVVIGFFLFIEMPFEKVGKR